MVIMEVSATTVLNQSDKRFHTASILAVVTSGFPLLLTRSGRDWSWCRGLVHAGDVIGVRQVFTVYDIVHSSRSFVRFQVVDKIIAVERKCRVCHKSFPELNCSALLAQPLSGGHRRKFTDTTSERWP